MVGSFERTDEWSFECWFYQTATKSCALASNMQSDATMRGWIVTLYTGRNIGMILSSDNSSSNFLGVRTAASMYAFNSWNHVIFTYNGSITPAGFKCYVNGSSKTLSTLGNSLTSTIKSNNDLLLGHSPVYPYLNGRLDEVVIYTRVLTQTEVNQRYNAGVGTSNLFGTTYSHYLLNETTNPIVIDAVGGRNGITIGSPTWGSGKIGNAVYLNGSSQYIILQQPLLCWNYTAKYKNSNRLFKMNGSGKYPDQLTVPKSVDINSGIMMDEGKLINSNQFKIIQ